MKKNTQGSADESWARLDKRIERARARHELARPVMGTIFLVSGDIGLSPLQFIDL